MSQELRTVHTSPAVNDPSAQQRMASDPSVSSWVGASAGSGKTKVLTDRMLRLLLPREDGQPGTPPDKILALTFTKTAANEMALRLTARLSQWTVMPDEALKKDIEDKLLGRMPSQDELLAARKLFAKVVDTPGGLKIMTIHSFCQSVLGRFPIEAGLPPHFKPLEEGQAADLLKQASDTVVSQSARDPGSPLGIAVRSLGQIMNQDQFDLLLKTMSGERRQIQDILSQTFGTDGLYTRLCTLLDVPPGMDEQSALAVFCRETGNEQALRSACPVLAAAKSSKDQTSASSIQAFWDAPPEQRPPLYGTYKKVFLGGENQTKLPTKDVVGQIPHVVSLFESEAARILHYEETYKAVLTASSTRNIFMLGTAILDEYQRLKNERGGLDFDDLILKTLSLLKGEVETMEGLKVTPWILYKLDEGLEHILVDEAQDTNPEQWDIIKLLSSEFFTGLGSRDEAVRTMFVVGDEKQSIFSFQRAAPEKFGDMFNWFEKTITESGQRFVPVNISTSFRSVQIVLDAVDQVFKQEQTVRGLTQNYLDHIAHREGQAGLVELWPLFESKSTDGGDEEQVSTAGWDMPTCIVESRSGSSQMAEKIGDMIQSWLHKDSPDRLHSYGRRIKPGDVMILVRSRNAFVAQLVRELKRRSVPVSGVDRMILSEQLVVQDLCSAAEFALLPDDDLTLAELLKSPFIGMDEQTLYDCAQPREGRLWTAVKQKAAPETVRWLENLIQRAGDDHPYEFFSRIIQEPCPADSISGLRAIKKRLGTDALDPLDEFLNASLAYETGHTAGLQAFLQQHERGSSEIKRQMEEGGGAVRIMTVHGAKGLQAPIVFLPDTVRSTGNTKPDRMLWPHKTGLELPLYVPGKDSAPELALGALTHIQDKLDEEYRRLLYVAMTRAEERLYIGGYTGRRKPSDKEDAVYWYNDIRRAFENMDGIQRIPAGPAQDDPQFILRLESAKTADADKAGHDKDQKEETHFPLPDFLLKAAPAEPFPPQPLVPSRPSDTEPAAASPVAALKDTNRFKRGTITHKLLQVLPGIEKNQRKAAAQKFLEREALGLSAELQQSIAQETLAILNDPAFSAIFGPGSLAEIPVTGLLDNKTLISGQIDRLLVTDDQILIIDFKTNRPPPQDAKDVPDIYRRQMKEYADALQLIYPGRLIRTALLWTDGPRLMEIPV